MYLRHKLSKNKIRNNHFSLFFKCAFRLSSAGLSQESLGPNVQAYIPISMLNVSKINGRQRLIKLLYINVKL